MLSSRTVEPKVTDEFVPKTSAFGEWTRQTDGRWIPRRFWSPRNSSFAAQYSVLLICLTRTTRFTIWCPIFVVQLSRQSRRRMRRKERKRAQKFVIKFLPSNIHVVMFSVPQQHKAKASQSPSPGVLRFSQLLSRAPFPLCRDWCWWHGVGGWEGRGWRWWWCWWWYWLAGWWWPTSHVSVANKLAAFCQLLFDECDTGIFYHCGTTSTNTTTTMATFLPHKDGAPRRDKKLVEVLDLHQPSSYTYSSST